MKKPASVSNTKRIKAITSAALLSAMMLPATSVPAQANDVVADLEHTIMCMGLLISDPVKHLKVCGVNDNKVVNLNIANPGTQPPPATQQPEQENPPQEEVSEDTGEGAK